MKGRDIGGGYDYGQKVSRSQALELARRLNIPEWQAEMALADGGFLAQLRHDLRNRPYQVAPSSPLKKPVVPVPTTPSVASQNRSGWRVSAPLDVPGGIRTHQMIEQGANKYLPHGPANPVGARPKD
jgi:hypothetical protein